MTTTEITTQPGPFLAERLGGLWHPEPIVDDPDETSGHLELDGVFMYLGMGFTESDGHWLQIAYMYAKPEIGAAPSDTSACGSGLGTRVVNTLREWTDLTGIPLRFVAIENPGFFARFDNWDDATFETAEWGDGECWYYPAVD
jgi:hypothetical protein